VWVGSLAAIMGRCLLLSGSELGLAYSVLE